MTLGAASLKKKKTEFPTDMHAQCKLSGGKGNFFFLRAFSKNVLQRQIIIFHLASGNKMSKNCFDLTRKSKRWYAIWSRISQFDPGYMIRGRWSGVSDPGYRAFLWLSWHRWTPILTLHMKKHFCLVKPLLAFPPWLIKKYWIVQRVHTLFKVWWWDGRIHEACLLRAKSCTKMHQSIFLISWPYLIPRNLS